MEVFTINQLGRIISYEEMEGYGMQVVNFGKNHLYTLAMDLH